MDGDVVYVVQSDGLLLHAYATSALTGAIQAETSPVSHAEINAPPQLHPDGVAAKNGNLFILAGQNPPPQLFILSGSTLEAQSSVSITVTDPDVRTPGPIVVDEGSGDVYAAIPAKEGSVDKDVIVRIHYDPVGGWISSEVTAWTSDGQIRSMNIGNQALWVVTSTGKLYGLATESNGTLPDPPLIKQADKAVAEIGDVITYTITFDNTILLNGEDEIVDHDNVWIKDILPPGFIYVKGSSYVYPDGVGGAANPVKVDDPEGGRILYWNLTSAEAGGTIPEFTRRTLTYQVIVGPLVVEGAVHTNQAFAFFEGDGDGVFGNPCAPGQDPAADTCDFVLTNVARASVDATAGVFTPRGLVVGKVFHDRNGNGRQDPGEPGLAGVRIVLQTGLSVVIDGQGKFSVSNLTARRHVLHLDDSTLPDGMRATGRGSTRLVDMTLGGMFNVSFPVEEEP